MYSEMHQVLNIHILLTLSLESQSLWTFYVDAGIGTVRIIFNWWVSQVFREESCPTLVSKYIVKIDFKNRQNKNQPDFKNKFI